MALPSHLRPFFFTVRPESKPLIALELWGMESVPLAERSRNFATLLTILFSAGI
jgi:hypothetical protein